MRRKIAVLKKAVRQVRRHGPGLLVERFYRRKEILSSPPVPCDPGSSLEVHMQVCNRDWLNAFWTLKSLRRHSDADFGLFVYLDFNVPQNVRSLFEAHFPKVHVARHDWLDEQVRTKLAPMAPTLAALWRAHYSPTLYKMVNAWVCARRERVLYLDPDVLFFAPPKELFEYALCKSLAKELGLFNVTRMPPQDLADPGAFCLDETEVRRAYGLTLPRDFNAGIAVLSLPALDWGFLDEAIQSHRLLPDRTLMVDQTCLAILAAKCGWERLDCSRYVVDDGVLGTATVASHYFGNSRRDAFYAEGIPAVRKNGLPGLRPG
jgi:hypothetical protein